MTPEVTRHFLHMHEDLPPGIHTYPTLKGKRRFEMLQVANVMLAAYVAIHKLFMPAFVALMTKTGTVADAGFGLWYLYHALIWFLMLEKQRNPYNAYSLVYMAWFATGYLPLTTFLSFIHDGAFSVTWGTISAVLCYGSSLIFTMFLLYRLRMPTTAYLYHLEDRIIPNWSLAVPWFIAGLGASLAGLSHL